MTIQVGAFHKSINDAQNAIIYRLTNNILSEFLHFSRNSSNFTLAAQEKYKTSCKKGVSVATNFAETQMAQKAKTGLFTAGALVAAMAAASLPAAAQDVTPVVEQDRSGWSEEIRELAEADQAATAYAREKGVAILLHVGLDIQNHPESEALLEWVQKQFKDGFAKQGLDVGIFNSTNDAAGTGLVYHVGKGIYRAADPVMDLQTASDLIPDVAIQTRLALELAGLGLTSTPQPEG